MAQTYSQIQRQIEALQHQAEKLKAAEINGVVERIKVAIAHYGLTAEQLGLRSGKSSMAKAAKVTTEKSGVTVKRASAAAYADDSGNVWGGRGPRPRWLREAIAGGKSLEDFSTNTSSTKSAASVAKKSTAAKGKGKRKATAYRDEAGNHWSGFGPKPGWLKDALAAGKTLEELAGPPQN